MAAALSYYTLLSMAPLLLIFTGLGGVLLGQERIRDAVVAQVGALVGEQGATLARTVLNNISAPEHGMLSMVLGVSLTLLGATTVFAQLQSSLDRIMGVRASPSNALIGFLWTRLTAFALALGIGFLMLVSLLLSAVLAAAYDYVGAFMPGAPAVWQAVNEVVSLAVIAALIASLFKFVPNVRIAWRETWVGAWATAALLTLGKALIGLYLGRSGIGSAYGAAGSAVVLMVWVYYASLILFYGAELTRVIARRRGVPVLPNSYASAAALSPVSGGPTQK